MCRVGQCKEMSNGSRANRTFKKVTYPENRLTPLRLNQSLPGNSWEKVAKHENRPLAELQNLTYRCWTASTSSLLTGLIWVVGLIGLLLLTWLYHVVSSLYTCQITLIDVLTYPPGTC